MRAGTVTSATRSQSHDSQQPQPEKVLVQPFAFIGYAFQARVVQDHLVEDDRDSSPNLARTSWLF